MEKQVNAVVDASAETTTLINEPVAVINSIVSIASPVSSGDASGSSHVADRASENSSDFQDASISDDNNTPQHASREMTEMCNAGSDTSVTEESITQSEMDEMLSLTGSNGRRRRCRIISGVVLLLLIVLIIVLGIGLGIAYAVLGEEIFRPIEYLENTIDEAGEALSSVFR